MKLAIKKEIEKVVELGEPIELSRKNQKQFIKIKSKNKRNIRYLKFGNLLYEILYYVLLLTPFILWFQSDPSETFGNKISLLSACMAIFAFTSSSRVTFKSYFSNEMDKLAERFIYPIEPKSVEEIEREIALLLNTELTGKKIDDTKLFDIKDSDKKEGFIMYH